MPKNGSLNLPQNYINNNPNIIKFLQKCLVNYPTNAPSLLLTGCVGSGKSYLANTILTSLKNYHTAQIRHLNTKLITVDAKHYWEGIEANKPLYEQIESQKNNMTCLALQTTANIYRNYLNNLQNQNYSLPVLPAVIDDLGAEPSTQSSIDYIASLITKAYEQYQTGKNKTFIITTNLNSEQIQARYGG